MLRAQDPTTVKKYLKAFIYGREKVGKTTFCIQFPRPYLIDTEGGAIHPQYIELLKKSKGGVYRCNSFPEVLKEIDALKADDHPFKTVIIDSLTLLYSNLVSFYQVRVDNKMAGHYQAANRDFHQLLSALTELKMDVLLTSHSKVLYDVQVTNGKVGMDSLGDTYDCYKKTPYLLDLILEVRNMAGKRKAIVKGSRLTEFRENDNFDFTYENFCKLYPLEKE